MGEGVQGLKETAPPCSDFGLPGPQHPSAPVLRRSRREARASGPPSEAPPHPCTFWLLKGPLGWG